VDPSNKKHLELTDSKRSKITNDLKILDDESTAEDIEIHGHLSISWRDSPTNVKYSLLTIFKVCCSKRRGYIGPECENSENEKW